VDDSLDAHPSAVIRDRARGVLAGLACGDALGAPTVGCSADVIAARYGGPLTEMVGGGSFEWRPGQTTDATAMALCLARSVLDTAAFDASRAIDRYIGWYVTNPPGVEPTVDEVLGSVSFGLATVQQAVTQCAADDQAPSSGSIMRVAPLAIRYRADPVALAHAAAQDCALTHHAPHAAVASVAYARLLASQLNGEPHAHAFALGDYPQADRGQCAQLADATASRCDTALAIACCALRAGMTVEDGIVWAVNLGGDSDTHGALTGALLAARFGVEAIPARWRQRIEQLDDIITLADSLAALSTDPG
jgi:ADP-ribosyl-[dinitrogen reductase] hydrolase